MKNKGYAKCWGQIRCIMGDVQVANKTEVFGQESTLVWGGGGWELQDLSSFVLGENCLCILDENIQEAFFSCSGNSRILDYTVNSLSTLFVRSA